MNPNRTIKTTPTARRPGRRSLSTFLIALLALALAATFALPGVASAQETDPDPTVEGAGWLFAKGEGAVDISMAGRIQFAVDGDVTITDHAGDMRVRTHGRSDQSEAAPAGAEIILNDFQGAMHVVGSDFTVVVDGQVKLRANGEGSAFLDGTGVYKTRRGDVTVWDGRVSIGGTEVEPA